MKKILFPTNFSDISLKAFEYALLFAKKVDYKIIIFHTYDQNANIDPLLKQIYEEIDIDNFDRKRDTFPVFDELLSAHHANDIKIKSIVKKGMFIEKFKEYVEKKEDKLDLIIMGSSENKRQLFQIFTESNTIQILEEINKPIIVIPEKTKFDGKLNKIVFLVDYNEDEKAAIQEIVETANAFSAKVYVLHFDLAHGESIVPMMERFKNSLDPKLVPHLEFQSIDTISLKNSLHAFCVEKNIDLVCLMNHKRNYYQRLFSYSLTEDLLYNLNIPIMAIYAD